MEQIPVKHTVIFILILVTSTHCMIKTVNVIEGDVAFLSFTYSCNSTEVTLQHANRAPFYNSKSPTLPFSFSLKLRNETDGETCFLYLTINPVTRDDQGGYILTAYKDDQTQFEDDRILLFVSYPPGKASCSLSEEYIDPDWVRLQCTAPVGNIGGFIMCYQNGIKIPPLNPPQQHDEILSQTLLAKVGHLVYCCSVLDQTKDMCECKDTAWDPIQNKKITNVTDPCPPAVTTVQYPPYSRHPSSPSTKALTVTPPPISSNKFFPGPIVIISLLILVIVILSAIIVYHFMKHRKQKESSFSQMNVKKPANCEGGNGVKESDCRSSDQTAEPNENLRNMAIPKRTEPNSKAWLGSSANIITELFIQPSLA